MSEVNDNSAIGSWQSATYESIYDQLYSWCSQFDFAGHDPFDALNSPLFRRSPLNKSRTMRLAWTQVVKRAPADLRTVALVPRQRNAKGLALFALAQLSRHRRVKSKESEKVVRSFMDGLLSMKLPQYSGAAWGYNFDWQSRNFFARKNTATIVPTAFAARAFLEAARDLKDDEFLSIARSACDFILKDLPRSYEAEDEICFSYSPQSNTRIHNANLLAAEVLAGVGVLTGEDRLLEMAQRATRYVVKRQQVDGSWVYGEEASQSWVDNFHTAFILFSLKRVIDASSTTAEYQNALERGYEYWRETFFLADGWPKYYHDDPYPADAHSGASAIVTFLELADLDENSRERAKRVARWVIKNLRDQRGYFYYQKRRFYTIKIPYMRWSQAWMLYALARLLEEQCQ